MKPFNYKYPRWYERPTAEERREKRAAQKAAMKEMKKRYHPWLVCYSCGSRMVARRSRYGKHEKFYGCDSYPDCRVTVSLEDLKADINPKSIRQLDAEFKAIVS